MKKKTQLLWLLPLLVIFAACHFQNDNQQYKKGDYTAFELGRFEGLGEDAEWQILQAYLKELQSGGENGDLTINDVWVEKYYGAYCPPYLVEEIVEGMIAQGAWPYSGEEEGVVFDAIYAENQTVFAVVMGAAGQDRKEVSIRFWTGSAFVRDGNSVFLWHNGRLYALEEYFDHNTYGLLYRDHFLKIANQQNGLDFQTQRRILEDYAQFLSGPPSPWYDRVPILYLGTWNDHIVLIKVTSPLLAGFRLEIGGVFFYGPPVGAGDNYLLFGWKEGQTNTLRGLYEQGLISREDLVEIADELNAHYSGTRGGVK